jgi:hypothetical protein
VHRLGDQIKWLRYLHAGATSFSVDLSAGFLTNRLCRAGTRGSAVLFNGSLRQTRLSVADCRRIATRRSRATRVCHWGFGLLRRARGLAHLTHVGGVRLNDWLVGVLA